MRHRRAQEVFAHRGFVQHHPSSQGALFLHRSADRKYSFGGAVERGLAVSHLLRSPPCSFNVQHWNTRAPAPVLAGLQLPLVTPAACNYSLEGLAGLEGQCGTAGSAAAIVEVPDDSALSAAQLAANQAFELLVRGRARDTDLF